MKEGFMIICNECESHIQAIETLERKEHEKYGFSFYPMHGYMVKIECNHCGNEVYIEKSK
jgi:uncharacterized protein YlaI